MCAMSKVKPTCVRELQEEKVRKKWLRSNEMTVESPTTRCRMLSVNLV